MKKWIQVIVSFFFLTFVFGCQHQAIDIDTHKSEYYQEYLDYLNQRKVLESFAYTHAVKIQIEATTTKTIFGSGVVFETDQEKVFVLTNYHLVYDRSTHPNIFIVDHLKQKHQATFVYGHADYDLAILVFEVSFHTYSNVKFLQSSLDVPLGTYIAGYPNGEIYQMKYGSITNFTSIDLKGEIGDIINIPFEVLSLLLESESGSSGSAIYDIQGHLIGLVFAGNKMPNRLSKTYGIPYLEIINFINLYNQQKST